MDIWIRTQSKVSLINCTRKNIGLYGKSINGELNYVVAADKDKIEVLGEYKDEERANEVLDQIENVMDDMILHNIPATVIQMPKEWYWKVKDNMIT